MGRPEADELADASALFAEVALDREDRREAVADLTERIDERVEEALDSDRSRRTQRILTQLATGSA